MISYTVAEIAAITGGRVIPGNLPPGYAVRYIATDSRTLLNGGNTAFFALNGTRNNGHAFVQELADRGVRVFVVSPGFRIPGHPGVALVETGDTLAALQKLAAYHRSRFCLPVVAITGSNGKTIVKEWLNDLLYKHFTIVRSPKSYNSQIGVPLSVWKILPEHTLAIFEAGISLPGEMEKLERIIRPSIGVLTHMGDAHQENFPSLREKTEEKLKLFNHCSKLIVSSDQPEVYGIAEAFCREKGIGMVAWSTRDPGAGLFFSVETGKEGSLIRAEGEGISCSFTIPFKDAASVENACHCFAVLAALGLDCRPFTGRFEQLAPLTMRLEQKKGVNGCLLLNDYYNSDINSLEIALSVLLSQAESNHMEKIAILSDIQQSGFRDEELYGMINVLLENAGINRIFGIGRNISHSGYRFSMERHFFETTGQFLASARKFRFSDAAILIKGARDFRFEAISELLQQKAHQTVFEINLNALVENLNLFRSLLAPSTRIMVMVKAFSYGSGDVEISKLLQFHRVDYLAVAVTDEGRELREAGIALPVIVMNPEPHSFQQMIDYHLEPNLYSLELFRSFAGVAGLNALDSYPVHLKIDTGMNRLGIKTDGEVQAVIELLVRHPRLRLQSVFTHLVASDDPLLDTFTRGQNIRFREVSDRILAALDYPVMRHILNSAGIERFPEFSYEMVRLGIGLYGVSSTGLPLKTAGRLRSLVSQVKEVLPGESVGYNRSGLIEKPTRIAVLPVGYADGLDRRLGNGRGKVFMKGRYAPFIGNICMDICMVDVSDIPCNPGDEAELMGEALPPGEVAAAAGTIPYEILTGISHRVKRIYLRE